MPTPRTFATPTAQRLSYSAIRAGFTVLAVLFVAIWNIPVIMTVLTSFKSAKDVLSDPFGLPASLSLTAFERAWTIMSYGQLFINSVLYATFGSILAILLALVPAYVFSSLKVPGKAIVFVALLTTLMLPQQTVIIPLFDLLQSLNLLNTRLGLIIVHGVYGMSFQLLILTGFMTSIPKELFAAARIDGCTDMGIIRHIVIPLTIPAMAVGFTINFIDIWKEYFFALVFLSSDTVMPINIGIQTLTNPQYMSSMNLPAAAVVLAQLPIIVLFIFAYRAITQGLYTGSVKG
jgi:ABC-type glycerol-3-phosphate transport system permease component